VSRRLWDFRVPRLLTVNSTNRQDYQSTRMTLNDQNTKGCSLAAQRDIALAITSNQVQANYIQMKLS
jgi:hypothetical protein